MLSKELKTYNYGTEILKDIKDVYKDGEIANEYEKLLNDYKNLVNRYEKILKISDKFEVDFYRKNNDLKTTLDYTIKKAKTKIMDNIVEHRKTKVAKSLYREKILILESEVDILVHQNKFLKEKLDHYINRYGDVDVVFSKKDVLSYLLKFTLNKKKYENMTIKDVLSEKLNPSSKYYMCKIGIENFYEIVNNFKILEDIENFLKHIAKYIENSFRKEDIIFHYQYDEFYVFIENRSKENIETIFENINDKRDILGIHINFVCGAVLMQNYDDKQECLELCNRTFLEAQKFEKTILFSELKK